MIHYQYIGPKNYELKYYNTINAIEKYLDGINIEELRSYNPSLVFIYNWLILAIELRKKDIIRRLNLSKQHKEERNKKIEDEK